MDVNNAAANDGANNGDNNNVSDKELKSFLKTAEEEAGSGGDVTYENATDEEKKAFEEAVAQAALAMMLPQITKQIMKSRDLMKDE